jgi:hypothetical protein
MTHGSGEWCCVLQLQARSPLPLPFLSLSQLYWRLLPEEEPLPVVLSGDLVDTARDLPLAAFYFFSNAPLIMMSE